MTRTTTIGRVTALCLAGAAFAFAPAASAQSAAQEPAVAPAKPILADFANDGSMLDRAPFLDHVETYVDPRPVVAPVPPARPRVAAAQPRLRTAAAARPARAAAAPYLVVSNETGRRCATLRCLMPMIGISY